MPRYHYCLFVCIGSLFLLQCKSLPTATHSSENTSIQHSLDSLVKVNKIPGANFSILHKGQEQHFSAGFADIEMQAKMRPSLRLMSGSIGKTYAVGVLMQLIDEGQIALTDTILHHFPDSLWMKRLPNIESITVASALSHTTGLPRWVMNEAVFKRISTDTAHIWSNEDRLSYIFDSKAVHAHDQGWAYSDTNYLLLGMLIEKITGKEYYEVVQERLLVPFRLKETQASNQRRLKNYCQAYSGLGPAFNIPRKVYSNGLYYTNPQFEWTGGGMMSTTADLARWAKVYFEGKAFSDASLHQVITINKNGKGVFQGDSYGKGAFIYNTKHGIAYGHTGLMPGYNSIFAYFPEQKIALALQINCDYASGKGMSLVNYIEALLENI